MMRGIKQYTDEYIVLIIYLCLGCVVFAPFLSGVQRVHDSWLTEIAGYEIMIGGLYAQGRVFSSVMYRALHFFNPPYTAVMSVSVFLSVVFLSVSAYTVYYMTISYAAITGISGKTLAAIGAWAMFFNMFVAECMIFTENAVMSAGVLLAAIGCALFLCEKRKYYIAALVCVIIGMFCYQPSTAYFPPLVVLFAGIKHSDNIKQAVKQILYAAMIYGAAVMANYAYLLLFSTDTRFTGNVRVLYNIYRIFRRFFRFLLNCFGYMPDYVFLLFITVLLCALIYLCAKQKKYTELVFCFVSFATVFITVFALHLPMSSDNWYVAPRAAAAMGGIGGFIIIGMVLVNNKPAEHTLIFCVIFTLITIFVLADIQKNNYAANQLDMLELEQITESIRAYENNSGIKVSRILFAYDERENGYSRESLNNYDDLTNRAFYADWMLRYFFRSSYGEGITVELMQDALTEDEISRAEQKRAEHWYTAGKIVFEGDTVYLFITE